MKGLIAEEEGLREALCTLGNGFFCTRGAAPEAHADDVHYPGTYLAGGYNRLQSEKAGKFIENEDLVNLPNWLSLTFRIDSGRWFTLWTMSRHTRLPSGAGYSQRHFVSEHPGSR
jgi:alpha,alpha-trehalase